MIITHFCLCMVIRPLWRGDRDLMDQGHAKRLAVTDSWSRLNVVAGLSMYLTLWVRS